MLSLSPIVDTVRDVLDSHVRHLAELVGWATVVVAIGVALEAIEIIHDVIAWRKRRRRERRERTELEEVRDIFPCGEARGETEAHADHPKWVKRWLRVGLIAVVIGVIAEWRCGAKLEDAHNAVHKYDLGKILEADEKAGNAETSAQGAAAAAASAKSDAKTAKDNADAVAVKADALKRELSNAETRLVTVEKKRDELEKSLINLAVCNAPRVFPPWTLLETPDNRFDLLKPFATQVIIDFIPDFEARRAALYLRWALNKKAEWKVVGFNQTSANDAVDDGVDVQTFVFEGSKDPKERDALVEAEHRSESEADALIQFLRSYNWQAERGFPGDAEGHLDMSLMPPVGGLRIRIGLYPAVVYVTPPGDKDLAAAEDEREKQREASMKEFQENLDKERLKGLKGKELADAKARIAQFRAQTKALEDQYRALRAEPCRPLGSVFRQNP